MRALPVPTLVLDHDAGEPVVLVGPPQRLKGRVHLHNRHDQRVVISLARLHGQAPALAQDVGQQAALPSVLPALAAGGEPVSMAAILGPDQRLPLRIKARIHSQTPPGVYAAELAVGDQRVPVEIHVSEQVALEITPSELLVENRPGSRQLKQITLHNAGNVPLHIGNFGAVVLDDELVECKTVRAMLAEDDDQHPRSVHDWLSAYLRAGRRQLDGTGMLWVEASGTPLELVPGQTLNLGLTVRVPDNLDPRSRYRGVVFLYDLALVLTVVPIGIDRGASADAAHVASGRTPRSIR